MDPDSIPFFKNLLFVFNFIFVICGIVLISVGGIAIKNDFSDFFGSSYSSAPILLVVLGILIFPIVSLGCYGAIKEHRIMVMAFAGLMSFIFVCTLAGGIKGYTYSKDLESLVKIGMMESLRLQRYRYTSIWDYIQSQFHCCGVDGPDDYYTFAMAIPDSCCVDPNPSRCIYITEGCYNFVLKEMKKNIAHAGGCGVGIAVIELLGCIVAWCLALAIPKEYEEI